jgi:hypothetical protein
MSTSEITWRNYKSYLPSHIGDLFDSASVESLEDVTIRQVVDIAPPSLQPWQALLMDRVFWLTSGNAFPARIYAGSERRVESFEWNDDTRSDLVQDLWLELLGTDLDQTAHSGNQLVHIVRHATNLSYVKGVIKNNARRVLKKRFNRQAMAHLSKLVTTELKKSFTKVSPETRNEMDQPYTIAGIIGEPTVENHVSLNVGIREFSLMKPNSVRWGVSSDGAEQTFPRLYNRSEIRKAIFRIIEELGMPVTQRFVVRALESALVHLDEAVLALDRPFMQENDPEVPDFLVVAPGIVQTDDLGDLSSDEDYEESAIGGSTGRSELSMEVNETVQELREKLTERQIRTMRLHMRGLSLDDTSDRLGVSTKTISRDLHNAGPAIREIIEQDGLELVKSALHALVLSYGESD